MNYALRINSIAIIGAEGQMGGLFAERAVEAGLEVRALDKPLDEAKLQNTIPGADLVLLCVPIPALRDVAEKVAAHMSDSQILADVCSVKAEPVAHMCEVFSGPVVGTHPLFGPVLPEGFAPRVALTRGCEDDSPKAFDAVAEFMDKLGFETFETTPERHDKAMALIQGVNFVTSVAYFSAAAQFPDIEEFLTPSFERRRVAAQKLVTQDAELFEYIFEANPFSQDMVRLFGLHLNIAAGGDVNLLAERAKWWWRKDGLPEGKTV